MELATISPQPPKHLSDLQRQLWLAVLPLVDIEGVEWLTFQQAIVSAAIILELQQVIAEEGAWVEQEVATGGQGTVKIYAEHPALKTLERQTKIFNSLTDRLGWSPAARAKLKLESKPPAEEPKVDPFTAPPQLPAGAGD